MNNENNVLPDNPSIQVLKAGQSGIFTNYIYKAIPLAFDESMSYYETLLGLLNYLQNVILPTVNNNADAVAELQNLYIELKTYVDDYFTNLDVQQEINNKLDQMAYNGTLTALIKNYVDPIYQSFEDEINNQVSTLNTKVNSLASGSPLVASSTAGMTDTTRVYVNTTDGKWYYYDGDSWEIGGTYQATGISDNSIDYNELSLGLQKNLDLNENLINSVSKFVGYYLNYNNGETISNEAYTASDFIKVEPSTEYHISCLPTIVGLANIRYLEYGSDKSYLNIYHEGNVSNQTLTTGANTHYIRATSSNDNYDTKLILCLYKLSYINNQNNLTIDGSEITNNSIDGNSIKDKTLDLSSLKEYTITSNNLHNPITPITSNNIISDQDGNYIDFANYNVIEFQKIEGNTTYTSNNVFRVSLYDNYFNYIESYSNNSSQYITFTTTPNAKYYRLSVSNANINKIKIGKGSTAPTDNFSYVISGLTNNGLISSNIANILYNANNTINIKLIGDSITSGVGASLGKSWASLLKSSLESKFNCQVTNNGVSGVNSNYIVSNISTLISDTDDIVICMIGTNNRISQQTFNSLYGDLQTIYSYCKERNIKFIPMCSLPASLNDEERENGTFNVRYRHMDDIENVISAFSVDNKLEFIDLYEKVYMYCMTKDISINSLLADGLHPNDNGYYLMFRFITHCLGVDAKLENATW